MHCWSRRCRASVHLTRWTCSRIRVHVSLALPPARPPAAPSKSLAAIGLSGSPQAEAPIVQASQTPMPAVRKRPAALKRPAAAAASPAAAKSRSGCRKPGARGSRAGEWELSLRRAWGAHGARSMPALPVFPQVCQVHSQSHSWHVCECVCVCVCVRSRGGRQALQLGAQLSWLAQWRRLPGRPRRMSWTSYRHVRKDSGKDYLRVARGLGISPVRQKTLGHLPPPFFHGPGCKRLGGGFGRPAGQTG